MTIANDPRIWPESGVSRVPYRVYADPEIYAEEQTKLFRGPTWNFLAMEAEIAKPGDFKTTFIGDSPVIVVRRKDGGINAMVNRCAHRGNLVCIARQGHANEFACLYHNWTYDLDGKLTGVAFRRGINGRGGMPADFKMEEHGLDRLRVEVYAGLVFATFDPHTPPLADYLGAEMRQNMERVVGRKMVLLGTCTQYMPNNWKLYMENVRDSYHASLLHMFQATFRMNRLSMQGGIKLSDRGWHHISYSIKATDREAGEYSADKLRAVQDGFELADASLLDRWDEFPCGTTLAIQSIFPNFVVQQIYNSLALRLCLPKGPEECELVWYILGAADDTPAQHAMRIRQSNLVGPGGLISMEDGVVGGWVQRASRRDQDLTTILEMGGREVEPSDGRATEVSIRGFWNGYRETMGV